MQRIVNSNDRYWLATLIDRDGQESIVLYDFINSDSVDDFVPLYHNNKNRIINYKKTIVRKKLKPMNNVNIKEKESIISRYLILYSEINCISSIDEDYNSFYSLENVKFINPLDEEIEYAFKALDDEDDRFE
jgi:hypothetical protein